MSQKDCLHEALSFIFSLLVGHWKKIQRTGYLYQMEADFEQLQPQVIFEREGCLWFFICVGFFGFWFCFAFFPGKLPRNLGLTIDVLAVSSLTVRLYPSRSLVVASYFVLAKKTCFGR